MLALILALGSAVRILGLDHGRPRLVFHPDLPKQIRVAHDEYHGRLNLVRMYGDDFEYSLYPYGTSILTAWSSRLLPRICACPPGRPQHLTPEEKWNWDLRFRVLAASMFGVASVVLLLTMSRLCAPWSVAVCGLLFVLEPMLSQFSHYGVNDVPLACLLLLAWLSSARMPEERARLPMFSILTGLLLGVGFSVKYQALVGGIFPLCAWLVGWSRQPTAWRWTSPACLAAAWFGGVALTCPLVRDADFFFALFPKYLEFQAGITGRDLPYFTRILKSFREVGYYLWACRLLPLLAVVLWALWRSATRAATPERRVLMLGGGWFCLALPVGFVLVRDFVRPYDLLPAIACALGLAFLCLDDVTRSPVSRLHLVLVRGLALALAAWFGTIAFLDSAAIARTDTRVRAQEWAVENMEPGSFVIRDRYTDPFQVPQVKDFQDRYLVSDRALFMLMTGSFDYAVSSSLAYERFLSTWSSYYDPERVKEYAWIDDHFPVVAEFRDRSLFIAHPTIRIYRKPDNFTPITP